MQLEPPLMIRASGALRRDAGRGSTLYVSDTPDADADLQSIYRGKMVLCFGVALLFEPDFILPQLAVDDFGRQYVGASAIRFIIDHGDYFPRADVFGKRVVSGTVDNLYFKQIDIAGDLHMFAFATPELNRLIGKVDAIVGSNRLTLPPTEFDGDAGFVTNLMQRFLSYNTTSVQQGGGNQ